MKYIIVSWDQVNLKYHIRHYSHRFDDAEKQYSKWKDKLKGVQDVYLMVDAFQVKGEDAKRSLVAFLANVKSKQS